MNRRLHMSPSDADPIAKGGVAGDRGSGDGGEEPDADDPQAVAAAALAGDGSAWAALIARHNHKIVVSLLARGVGLDEARELAQETWLRLMQQQRTGKLTQLSLPGLAIVQAGFLAANDRRRGRAWAAEAAAAGAGAGGTTRTLEDEAIGRQRLALLGRAWQDCPAGARRVFEQVYDNPELSYAEVAPRVGLSVARVKQIVFEVRKRLRAALDRQEHGDGGGSGGGGE
jgi:DNA-directed RNA polymerase specialized sigma24 family protein